MTDPLEPFSRRGVQPRLFILAVVLALILAAASLWWLTGPSVQVSTPTFTPSTTPPPDPGPRGPSGS